MPYTMSTIIPFTDKGLRSVLSKKLLNQIYVYYTRLETGFSCLQPKLILDPMNKDCGRIFQSHTLSILILYVQISWGDLFRQCFSIRDFFLLLGEIITYAKKWGYFFRVIWGDFFKF